MRLSAYVDKEKALKKEMEEKERVIADLTKERDANAKRVEVLQLELKTLESKVKDAEELEASKARLQKELADAASSFEEEKSTMASQMATTEGKIGSLEKELEMQRKSVSTTV